MAEQHIDVPDWQRYIIELAAFIIEQQTPERYAASHSSRHTHASLQFAPGA